MALTEIWAPCERPHSLAEILDCAIGERNACIIVFCSRSWMSCDQLLQVPATLVSRPSKTICLNCELEQTWLLSGDAIRVTGEGTKTDATLYDRYSISLPSVHGRL